jgi:hypothetical protein
VCNSLCEKVTVMMLESNGYDVVRAEVVQRDTGGESCFHTPVFVCVCVCVCVCGSGRAERHRMVESEVMVLEGDGCGVRE